MRSPRLGSRSVAVRVLALSFALAALGLQAAAGASTRNVCGYLTRGDVGRIMGWHVDSMTAKRYDLGGLSGRMCVLESKLGVLTVTVPDPGSPFPGITAFNTMEPELVRTLKRRGAYVAIYNGAVYATRHGVDVSVHVVPSDHPASYADVEPFVDILLRKMK